MEFNSPEHDALRSIRAKRQASTPIPRWSHIATRVRDLEATRHFYEDVLGLPLVTVHAADVDPEQPDVPMEYIHAFFELGDGSCIAFFQFAPGYHKDPEPHSPDLYERHLAMQLETMDDIQKYQDRLTAAGVPWKVINHGSFYSIYINDPDGDTIELTYHKPRVDLIYCQENPGGKLADWLAQKAPKGQS